MNKIKCYNRQITLPNNDKDKDIFIGKWRKLQEKALLKAIDETIKLTKQGIINYNFDDIVDKYTLYYYDKENK
tara:strand:- start:270 stop:488 length:219 start_codon:yes stop_codon:yes gene_type:complete